MSTLSTEQKNEIAKWVNEGLSLSAVQDRIQAQFHIVLSYRDVRFLIDDLGLALKDKPNAQPAQPTPQPESVPQATETQGIQVSVDKITRPGTAISGQVTFSDGVAAQWQLDAYGRIGIVPPHKGYTPSQEDLASFQTKIQEELQRLGY